MRKEQYGQVQGGVPAQAGAANIESNRAGLLRQVGEQGERLIADLSEFFTRRKHGRGGLYLPLVRVDREP